MSSTLASPQGRCPQQDRAARRRAKFLEVAERQIAKIGYEAVTMTAIAQEACASIGTLYDYFPDKQSVAFALLAEYTDQADAHWARVLSEVHVETSQQMAELFVDALLQFARDHPAYLPLLGAPIAYARNEEARKPLRKTIGTALQKIMPRLSAERAYLSAQIIVELMKGMLSVHERTAMKNKGIVIAEFKKFMLAHMTAH